MAKRKERRYVFTPGVGGAGTIKIPGHVEQKDLLLVVNSTDGIIIMSQFDAGKNVVGRTHDHVYPGDPNYPDADFPFSEDGTCTFTLEFDTSGMSADDELGIYIDDQLEGDRVSLGPNSKDAIERIRVSEPQQLIDADFEYGLQTTKWTDFGCCLNHPSFYRRQVSSLLVSSVVAAAISGQEVYSEITVTLSGGTAPQVGEVVFVAGLADVTGQPRGIQAEGVFIVNTRTSDTVFSYVAKDGWTASTNLETTFTDVKEGGFYTNARMTLSTFDTDNGTDLITITFAEPHNLVPGSPIIIVEDGTNDYEGSFFVDRVVDVDTIVVNPGVAQQNVSLSGTATDPIDIYCRTESFFLHRPYDGGVILGPGLPVHGLDCKRQTKRYFRYQSGKGIAFQTGVIMNPVYEIDSINGTGTTVTVTTADSHGLQAGAIVRINGVDAGGVTGFDFEEVVVDSVTDNKTFTYTSTTTFAVSPGDDGVLSERAKCTVVKWFGSSLRLGMFDDQNGLFWEYDGQDLYAVKRSSTFQTAGTIAVTNNSEDVTGTDTRFTEQYRVGDFMVIRGQRYEISTVTNDTTITICPRYRGVTEDAIKVTKTVDTRYRQDLFSRDTLDGTGPSGYNMRKFKMQMLGINWSWYGAGYVDFTVRANNGEYISAHRIMNSNINDEAYMRSGNLPARYEVANGSARNYLTAASDSGTGASQTLTLKNAAKFPVPGTGQTAYALLTSPTGDTEIVTYTGKTSARNGDATETLTGVTRLQEYTININGTNKTFGVSDTGNTETNTSTAIAFPVNTTVRLLNTTCSPTISHWGSAVIMDGGFDDDTGYIFNYADYNLSSGAGVTAMSLAHLRLSPSVSNTLPGAIGERELVNRSILQPTSLSLQVSTTSPKAIEVIGILNPQFTTADINAQTWSNINEQTSQTGSVNLFQPSFAQYLSNADLSEVPADGEVLFRFIANSGGSGSPGFSTIDISSVKELENGVLGGDNEFPDGPEILTIVATNLGSTDTVNIVLNWTEAQA